jgi:hypothetical protein
LKQSGAEGIRLTCDPATMDWLLSFASSASGIAYAYNGWMKVVLECITPSACVMHEIGMPPPFRSFMGGKFGYRFLRRWAGVR